MKLLILSAFTILFSTTVQAQEPLVVKCERADGVRDSMVLTHAYDDRMKFQSTLHELIMVTFTVDLSNPSQDVYDFQLNNTNHLIVSFKQNDFYATGGMFLNMSRGANPLRPSFLVNCQRNQRAR